MTALPRSLVDVPTNPVQMQNAAAGRHSQDRVLRHGGAEGDGDVAVKFSSLLGKLGAQVEAPVGQKSPQLETEAQPLPPVGDPNVDQIPNNADIAVSPGTLPSAQSGSQGAQMRAHTLDLNFAAPRLSESLQQTASAARSSVATSVLSVVTSGSVGETATLEATGQTIGKLARPAEAILRSEKLAAGQGDGSLLPARGEGAGPMAGVQAKAETVAADRQVQIGQPAATRSDLAALRVDNGTAQKDRMTDRAKPTADVELPHAKELPRLDVSQQTGQVKTATVPTELANGPSQTSEPMGVSHNTASALSPSASDNAGDLQRLQDVKVLGTRVVEMPLAAGDRAGHGTTVKVIELQLQPETLGRIGAQMKQTGGVLEVRLEPSLAETALLLKEDRLALQRILGTLGSISDLAVVRIIDPVTEQRLGDGQDPLAESELGQADHAGGQSAASGDLQGEGYSNDDYQYAQTTAEQATLDIGRQRAPGDIYI